MNADNRITLHSERPSMKSNPLFSRPGGQTSLHRSFLRTLVPTFLLAVGPALLLAAGIPGPQIAVNTSRSGYQFVAATGMNQAGNFVVAWSSQGAGGVESVFAQRFNPDATPLGAEIRVDDPNFQPYQNPIKRDVGVAVDANGNFVVVWTAGVLFSSGQFSYDFNRSEIYAQRFDYRGTNQGPNFLVNTERSGAQEHSAVGIDGFGIAIIVWKSGDGSSTDIHAQRFDFSQPYGVLGNEFLGSEFVVNSFTNGGQYHPAVAMNPWVPACPPFISSSCAVAPLDFYIVWDGTGSGGDGIFARGFSANNGLPTGSQFRVNTNSSFQERPSVGMSEDGRFVVAWQADNSVGNGIFARRFLEINGTPLGGEFQVATLLGNVRSHFVRSTLGVSAMGKFVLAWNDLETPAGGNEAIFARVFDAAGVPEASPFPISQGGPFYRPSARMDAAGNFVTAYEGGNDGSFYGIYARRNGSPTLYINDVSVTEGNSGTTNAIFTVTLSPASTQTVSVAYSTANFTAASASDFQPSSGTLTFAPGATDMQIVVHVNSDTQPEADESFRVNLSNPTNAPIAKSSGVGTILNDDPCPGPALSASISGTNCTLRFQGASSCTYQLEYKNSLNSSVSWTNLRTISGIGGTIAVTDTNATSQARFYRAWTQ
jgi:hypothetical protein